MISDAQLRCSLLQSLAGAAGTTVSTNVIDLLSANRDLGRGQPMRARVSVPVSFAGGTSMQPQLIGSPNPDLSNPTVIASGPVMTDAQLPSGTVAWDTAMPDTTMRYLGFQYVTVGTHTAGSVTAHVLSDTDYNPYVPSVTGY